MRRSTQCIAIKLTFAVNALAFTVLAVGCAGGGAPPSSGLSPLQLNNADLLRDIGSLDSGVLGYQVPMSIPVGADDTLSVQVVDIGEDQDGFEPLPTDTGFVFSREDVPAGGMVGVTASCQNVECQANAPVKQPVLPRHNGIWSWQLSAERPGTAEISLVATAYDQDTATVLKASEPIEITITVTATSSYWASQAGKVAKAVLGFIGFAGLCLIAAWLKKRFWKRKEAESSRSDAALASVRQVGLADIMAAGLLKEGTVLHPRRSGVPGHTATVLPDGTLEVDGIRYPTPSGAALAVSGTSQNGWQFWLVDPGHKLSLATLRQQYLERRAAG